MGRGVRGARDWSVLLKALAAERRLRLDFWLGLRAREEDKRLERWPWLPSSSDQRDCSIFSPIRGVAEGASGGMGALALVRCMEENKESEGSQRERKESGEPCRGEREREVEAARTQRMFSRYETDYLLRITNSFRGVSLAVRMFSTIEIASYAISHTFFISASPTGPSLSLFCNGARSAC